MILNLWLVRTYDESRNELFGGYPDVPHKVFIKEHIAHNYIMSLPGPNGTEQQCYGKNFKGATRIRYNGYVIDPIEFRVPDGIELDAGRPNKQMGDLLATINATIDTLGRIW